MTRLRTAIIILASALGLILGTLPAQAATGYHWQEGYACSVQCAGEAFVELHTTNSGWQIWINGQVSCPVFNVLRGWCGVGGGNGTGTLDTGVNFSYAGRSYWFRLDLHADGTCTVRGNGAAMVPDTCFGLRERAQGAG